MLVYIITAGEYSDYHIERVYDNPDEAWKYYNAILENSDSPRIAVFDTKNPEKQDNTLMNYYVFRDADDGVWNVWETMEYMFHNEYHDEYEDGYRVRAKDESHALKIAQDRHAEWKAMREGIT